MYSDVRNTSYSGFFIKPFLSQIKVAGCSTHQKLSGIKNKSGEENVEYSYDGIFWLYKEWTRSKFINID